MTSAYGRRGSFWSVEIQMDDSPLWKGIICTRDDVITGLGLPLLSGTPDLSGLYGGNGRIMSGKVYEVLRRRSIHVDWGPIV